MLSAGNIEPGKDIMDLPCQLNLDTLVTGLDAVRRPVVQRNPVGKNTVGIKPLDEKKRLIRR